MSRHEQGVSTTTLRLAAVAAAAALLAVPAALADAAFSDPVGDGGGAPDITDVTVVNDAFNRVAFVVKLAGGKAMAGDTDVAFIVDSDKNADTGSNGWDHLIVVTADEQRGLFAWNGTEWVEAPATTLRAYFYGSVVIVALDRSELGNTTSFDFFAEATLYSGEEAAASDVAPDGDAVWSYATVGKSLGLGSTAIMPVTKGGARQGKAFVAGYVYGRTDSPEPARGARTTCAATVGGKPALARVASTPEAAACNVTVPRRSAGKLLKLTMRTTFSGKSVTKTYSTTVKA